MARKWWHCGGGGTVVVAMEMREKGIKIADKRNEREARKREREVKRKKEKRNEEK